MTNLISCYALPPRLNAKNKACLKYFWQDTRYSLLIILLSLCVTILWSTQSIGTISSSIIHLTNGLHGNLHFRTRSNQSSGSAIAQRSCRSWWKSDWNTWRSPTDIGLLPIIQSWHGWQASFSTMRTIFGAIFVRVFFLLDEFNFGVSF